LARIILKKVIFGEDIAKQSLESFESDRYKVVQLIQIIILISKMSRQDTSRKEK